ncbi:MAG: FAD-dependent oxidoreductase, partial [Chloroflexota bacterium]|nr:FAD-dependent oxidoreductase [Chloroflexota bacterium]
MSKKKVVVVGGGWAGTAAAISAAKAGADVVLLERTDLLLGTGLAGGYLRNNGRYTAAEEIIALGAGELINCMDSTATNGNRDVEMPNHKHGTVYNVFEIEPLVRKAVLDFGAKILFQHRFTDVIMDGKKIKAVKCANYAVIEGDAFVDCTGTSGSQPNCQKYGSGCACCILRCPTFGSRVGVAGKAGVRERSVKRADGSGKRGAYSGACEIPKETVDPALRKQLEA